MRITCPACEASYDVPEAMLAKRRVVRCARCGVDWSPPPGLGPALDTVPASDLGEVEKAPLAVIDQLRDDDEPRALTPGGTGAITAAMGWLASFALLALLAWALVHWRHSVEAAWPPGARAYSALGLTDGK